jgi:signal transduction histidine kinase
LRKTQIVVDEVARLEELLSDLLDMARPRQLNLQSQDVNAIVEHALLLANADIQGLNVTVQKHLDEGLPPILVDRSRLLQALLNTVRNGAQAMPEGGVLEITTRVPQLSTGLASHLEIEIRDHGIGISERGLAAILMFTRRKAPALPLSCACRCAWLRARSATRRRRCQQQNRDRPKPRFS